LASPPVRAPHGVAERPVSGEVGPPEPGDPGGVPGKGLRGHPLRWYAAGTVGALVTALPEGQAGPWGRADLLVHHELVVAACERGPCLPVRFGTWITGEDALRRGLAERAAELGRALERVRGRRELAVTLLWRDGAGGEGTGATAVPAPEPDESGRSSGPAGPGRRYLEARWAGFAAERRRRETVAGWAGELAAACGLGDSDVRHTICPSSGVALSSALLVQTELATALKERVLALGRSWGVVRCLVNGPWPPYSFATLDLSSSPQDAVEGGATLAALGGQGQGAGGPGGP
ncbi:MAG TPA: GvpL/GvpF family gas vesicle protein, partial [Chloroflexota bacterium]|nr:GvpL/GvpF family gas vesicle protein [Chloroflexota bacterium]